MKRSKRGKYIKIKYKGNKRIMIGRILKETKETRRIMFLYAGRQVVISFQKNNPNIREVKR
ncbi:hypothetical protein [Candidatus Vidania fulgoroideorum]